MKNRIKIITAFSVGFILALGIGVYAAVTYNAKEVGYKNKTVEQALDELYQGKNSQWGPYICKRATKLHTEICEQTGSNGCAAAGYTASGSKGTTTITYGNLGTSGTLTSGDAFDCDVNGNGKIDEDGNGNSIERFYYVSEYYNTETKQFESDTATLIYYSNVNKGIANNLATCSYHNPNYNYNGPVIAVEQLPTTSQWKNISLKNNKRSILNQVNGNTTSGGNLPGNGKDKFDYSAYVARLLTVQEINVACNITIGSELNGELDNCVYLLENTKFSSSIMKDSYWLETAYSGNYYNVYSIYGNHRAAYGNSAVNTAYSGTRPVIEVPISQIEY